MWLKEGDTIYRKKYAQTLRDIGASGNASYFYDGQFMKRMVEELKENGAILEEEDFLNYTAIEREPVESEFDGLRIIGVPPPSSGAVLALILNILQGLCNSLVHTHSLIYIQISAVQDTTSRQTILVPWLTIVLWRLSSLALARDYCSETLLSMILFKGYMYIPTLASVVDPPIIHTGGRLYAADYNGRLHALKDPGQHYPRSMLLSRAHGGIHTL